MDDGAVTKPFPQVRCGFFAKGMLGWALGHGAEKRRGQPRSQATSPANLTASVTLPGHRPGVPAADPERRDRRHPDVPGRGHRWALEQAEGPSANEGPAMSTPNVDTERRHRILGGVAAKLPPRQLSRRPSEQISDSF
jgi:hypothetical protein